jgi:hypothetical protein
MHDPMAGPESPSGGYGTEAGGFRLLNTASEFRVECWGYWNAEVCAAFRKHGTLAAWKLTGLGAFVLDAKQLKPQGNDGQEALREFFRALSATPFTKGSVSAENALTRMQLTRLVREGGLDGRMTFV